MKGKLLYMAIVAGMCAACQDFLDVKPVGKFIPTEVEEFGNLLNNPKTIQSQFTDNNRGTLLAYLGDNLYISESIADYYYTVAHPNVDRYAAYVFKMPYTNPEKPDYFWENGYQAVGLFNNVIDGVKEVKTEATAKLADELSAQACAGRAWVYLTHSMVYGPVYDPAQANDTRVLPYRTTASPIVANPDLSTTAEIFNKVKTDLEFAMANAPDLVGNPSKANKCASQALMAYYYMFTRDFEKMLEYSDMAWETALAQKGGVEQLIYDYNKFYYQADPSVSPSPGTDAEVSLTLMGPDALLNQTYHRENLFYRVASVVGAQNAYPSEEFLKLFDTEKDMRYRLFFLKGLGYSSEDANVNDGVQVQYYRDSKMNTNQGLTYPELLLMRAEALARTHQKGLALADLNTLRKFRYNNSSGTTDLPGGDSLSEDQLLEEILKERRRELPYATFQRILDLKRLSLDAGKPWCKMEVVHKIGNKDYTASVQSEYFILPVPNNIIKLNPAWGLSLETRPYQPK